jgi:hypothetical protein
VGIPVLHINASYGENEKAMAMAMREHLGAILDEMKLSDAKPPRTELSVFGKNIHECGTARMGNDPKKSVVDSNCKVHDTPNVFVTDGAVFTTQGCYEPTLTIMAISVAPENTLHRLFVEVNCERVPADRSGRRANTPSVAADIGSLSDTGR